MSRDRVKRSRRSDSWAAMAFLAPLAVIYGVYYVYSIAFLVRTSTTKVSISFRNAIDVGWNNYVSLLHDSAFLRSIANTVIFAACSIVSALVLGFVIAAALATGVRARKLYYVIFLVPTLMPSSLVATIFGSMLQERFGVVNETLRALGLGALAQPWLSDRTLAFGVIVVIFCYLIGLPIMYFTADFSTLPTESLEAALLDGAGTFTIMRSIVYPMMAATRTTIILSLLLGSFRALEVVWFSTQGGPGQSTEIVGSYLYDFATSSGPSIGFVSAAAIVVLLIAFVISTIQMLISGRKERI